MGWETIGWDFNSQTLYIKCTQDLSTGEACLKIARAKNRMQQDGQDQYRGNHVQKSYGYQCHHKVVKNSNLLSIEGGIFYQCFRSLFQVVSSSRKMVPSL